MATLFDTLGFARKLTDAGLDRGQSEAIAGAVHEALRGSVATKSDLDDVRNELRLGIQGVRAEVLVLKWMTGAIVAGVLALVVKAFF